MKKFLATSLALVTMLSLALSLSLAPVALAVRGDVEGEIFDTLSPSAEVYGQEGEVIDAETARTALANGVADIIQIVLSILGIILIILIIYAGFLWMTAGGNDERISKAKKIIVSAVIGLAIILSAYLITVFVVSQLIQATGAGN